MQHALTFSFEPMKHLGSYFPYKAEREKELMTAFRSILASVHRVNMMNVFREVVSRPCSRYWVTEERVAVFVSSIRRGTHMPLGRDKHDMYMSLYRRFLETRSQCPNLPYQELIFLSVNSPAPRFFLSPSLAKTIINGVRYAKR